MWLHTVLENWARWGSSSFQNSNLEKVFESPPEFFTAALNAMKPEPPAKVVVKLSAKTELMERNTNPKLLIFGL